MRVQAAVARNSKNLGFHRLKVAFTGWKWHSKALGFR
jgi:hypothetical protein